MFLLLLAHANLSKLKEISTSPVYNEGLSNRLSVSVDRIRFLGMIVGEAISRKVDPENQRLKFKVPETEDSSAEAWRSLIDVDDELYPLKSLQEGIVEDTADNPVTEEIQRPSGEDLVFDESDDPDKDLPKYPVPEFDAEDSDDDPTLVSREKISKPLYVLSFSADYRYIRDLMKYLREDNYNKVNMALKTAPNLIREKANFGTELSSQATDLTRILIGLQDSYEMEKFQEMRQSALIALVASAAETVAPYLINLYFTGDISIQQRCIILSALGIGLRELAGLEKTVHIFVETYLGTIASTVTTTITTSSIYFSHGSSFTAT
jgi:telomere length regulation protein